jgi:hypothetical protein
MRRAIGIGGATFVAVGAALVLTLPASAHEASATPGCASDGHATIHITTLKDYNTNTSTPKPNSVTVTEGTVVISAKDPFGKTYDKTVTLDGTKVHNVIVHFKAWDDPTGSSGWTVDIPVTTTVCTSEHPSSTTTYPPTSTTVPPTHTTTVPPTTTIAAETTTAAVVAAATTTGSGTLPFTGVNATFPLLIAGVLVIAGGGILLWLRLAARRRRTNG